jgi:hypothetical protein
VGDRILVVSKQETGFLLYFWWGGKDGLKKPGFWGKGDRAFSLSASKKPVFYEHFGGVTKIVSRNPVSGAGAKGRSRILVVSKQETGFL